MEAGRPPVPKKGIRVTQHHPHLHSQTQLPLREGESVRSSRSRGISMSRDSGITLDRIYDNKHFSTVNNSHSKDKLNINTNSNDRSTHSKQKDETQTQSHTLISYKSLQLIPLHCDSQKGM